MWAAAENHLEAVKLLIERGTGPDVQAKHLIWPEMKKGPAQATVYPAGGLTARMEAVWDISIEAAQALLKGGAKPNLKNPNELIAMNIEVAKAHLDMAKLLVENGAAPCDGSLMEPWMSGIRQGVCAGRFPRISIDASAHGG